MAYLFLYRYTITLMKDLVCCSSYTYLPITSAYDKQKGKELRPKPELFFSTSLSPFTNKPGF